MNRKIQSIATALFFLISGLSYAQTNNLAGIWNFKEQQSISGNLYANGSPKQVTIKQTNDIFEFEFITADEEGDTKSNEKISSGKELESTTPMGRKKISKIQWSADGKTLTETTNIYSKTDVGKFDFKFTDSWTITDGKLILDRKNENFTNGETWESKATYEKQ